MGRSGRLSRPRLLMVVHSQSGQESLSETQNASTLKTGAKFPVPPGCSVYFAVSHIIQDS